MSVLEAVSAFDLPLPELDGPGWALFLDVDGTLLELADHPDKVLVPAELLILLHRLHKLLDGAVALVSGRNISTLDRLLQWQGLDAAGCHGSEFRKAGNVVRLADESVVSAVSRILIGQADTIPLSFVEQKGQSIAFHYRSSSPDADDARLLITQALGGLQGFRIIHGKNVIEIVPEGAGKDIAISRFMQSPRYAGKFPVFIGDDISDEDGFQEVNSRGGLSIRIGRISSTIAKYKIANVSDLFFWLSGPFLLRLEQRAQQCINQRVLK